MRRAQGLSINTIVLAALALIVLVLLIMLVRTQIQKGAEKYTGITKTAEEQAQERDICESVFAYPPRRCLTQQECTERKGFVLGGMKGCADGRVCCET